MADRFNILQCRQLICPDNNGTEAEFNQYLEHIPKVFAMESYKTTTCFINKMLFSTHPLLDRILYFFYNVFT